MTRRDCSPSPLTDRLRERTENLEQHPHVCAECGRGSQACQCFMEALRPDSVEVVGDRGCLSATEALALAGWVNSLKR